MNGVLVWWLFQAGPNGFDFGEARVPTRVVRHGQQVPGTRVLGGVGLVRNEAESARQAAARAKAQREAEVSGAGGGARV